MLNSELWQAPLAGGGDFYDYQIANSARFDGSASYLNKTWGSAPSSTTQVALSVWLKKSFTGNVNPVSIFTAIGNTGSFYFNNDDAIADNLAYYMGSGGVNGYTTNIRYRDPSAWFHFVAIINSAASNDYDRLKIYINGELIALNSGEWTQNSGHPNTSTPDAGKNGVANYIGRYGSATRYWDGYMADFIQIDGAAAISDFGETKNGVWIPKDPSGLTFGNNGFHLNFASSGDMGNDVSGNNNDWTANSIAASDQTGDSPTFNSDSNGGNFATIGPLWKTSGMTFSEGNLKWTCSTNERGLMSNWAVPIGTKAYWEYIPVTFGGNTSNGDESWIGINQGIAELVGGDRGGKTTGYAYGTSNGYKTILASASSYGATIRANDVVGVAVDRVNHTINFSKNGSWQGTFAISATMDLFPFIGSGGGTSSATGTLNFGADGTFAGTVTAGGNADENGYGNFLYTPPSGFLALCSGNLPTADAIDPAQTDDNYPQKLFAPKLYTGDGASTLTISGMDFQPDWTWIKARNDTSGNKLFDSTRGVTKYLASDSTALEVTASNTLKSWTSDGYTVGDESGVNTNTNTYASWNWRANGGTTTSNGNGSLASVTQTDPSGCFSIGTYTANATNSTIGHGLSVAPNLIILKKRDNQTKNWMVWGTGLGNDTQGYISLDTTGAMGTDSQIWQNTAPTSSVFSVNYGTTETNAPSGDLFVFYAFANCEGYIKSGSYIGNGDADGTFVYTGFSPAFLLVKGVVSGASWTLIDNKRDGYNPIPESLEPNSSGASYTGAAPFADLLSNGFKVRTTNAVMGSTSYDPYLYLAFAENPFKYATAR